jgi:hypothetical protein
MWMASTSGLQLPSAVRFAGARWAGGAILPWALPLAGFAGACRASAGLDPGSDHPPPAPSWADSFARDDAYPLMGLPTILPITVEQPGEFSRRAARL